MSVRHNPYVQATLGGLAVIGFNVIAGVVLLSLVFIAWLVKG